MRPDPGCSEYRELSRRQFIAGASAAAFGAATLPAWLPRVVLAESANSERDVIVSIFLRGGADGLSMVVPFGDPAYYTSRPTIAVAQPDASAQSRVTALDDYFGLPPAMAGLLPAYRAGELLAVHAAGVTVANRSHFDMQRFVEVGKANDPSLITGWLGRHLASVPPRRSDAPLRALGIAAGLPKTLHGSPRALPIADPTTYGLAGTTATRQARADWLAADYFGTVEPLRAAGLDATATLALLRTIDFASYRPANAASYPTSAFGRSLRSTAALIKADVGVEAVQVDLGGWDTHVQQDPNAGSMYRTMLDFASALGAFWQDMIQGGSNHSVTVVALSEFGRNVRENGSQGTDHGRASAMFVLGRAIAGGRVLTHDWPGLERENLEAGQDLRVTLDHRDVLAEIVARRLSNPNGLVVFPDYEPTFRGVTK